MAPDFSVIIPTFRRPKQLAEAITSALEQAGVEVEVIVVDDSPEAAARAVIERIADARVQYLRNPSPTGGFPSVVRNLGWPLARGSFIHFLDDDDIVPEGHYAAVKKIFFEQPRVGAVFGHIEPFGDGPDEQLRHERQFFGSAAKRAQACRRFGPRWGFTATMMFRRTLLITSAGIVRRECVHRVGGFDPAIRVGEDVDFYARVFRQGGVYFMDRASLKFRVGHPSIMHTPPPDKTEAQLQSEARQQLYDSRRRTHARYRKEWGTLEFYLLKAFAHSVVRFL
jgi:glycosyltransferase involved in cell wall biosynthesis